MLFAQLPVSRMTRVLLRLLVIARFCVFITVTQLSRNQARCSRFFVMPECTCFKTGELGFVRFTLFSRSRLQSRLCDPKSLARLRMCCAHSTSGKNAK